MSLNHRVALVTGGGSGVGLAVAEQLLRAGAKVAIAGRDPAKLDAGRESLRQFGPILAVPMDVSDPASVEAGVARVVEQFGTIGLLVNNAGVNIKERAFRELTPQYWQQLLRTNLDGAFYCTRAVLPGMLQQRDGVIININSVSGKRANPLAGAAYAASKFGMAAMLTCLGVEEREQNIRICNIYPGEIDTAILDARPTPVTAEQRKVILRPADVAAAVLFVASQPDHVSIPELIIKPTAHVYF
jgi:NAD(P)-dependent dehydrogenase (short-subunit alcohol dehydrogenase family)